MSLAEVTSIYTENLRDIPAMLRKLANAIEAGEHGEVAGVVSVLRAPNYSVKVFGHGEENYAVSIVSMELGKLALLKMAP